MKLIEIYQQMSVHAVEQLTFNALIDKVVCATKPQAVVSE